MNGQILSRRLNRPFETMVKHATKAMKIRCTLVPVFSLMGLVVAVVGHLWERGLVHFPMRFLCGGLVKIILPFCMKISTPTPHEYGAVVSNRPSHQSLSHIIIIVHHAHCTKNASN